MPDTPPAERGSPAANPPKKGGSVLTRQMGPLPVWGWAAVAVAGVFLFRMMSNRKAANEAQSQAGGTASLPYVPGGGIGGVFMLPESTSSGATSTPTPSPTAPAGTFHKVGSGFYEEQGGVIMTQGSPNTGMYQWVGGKRYVVPGQLLYYQPSEGQFKSTTLTRYPTDAERQRLGIATNTPLYYQTLPAR